MKNERTIHITSNIGFCGLITTSYASTNGIIGYTHTNIIDIFQNKRFLWIWLSYFSFAEKLHHTVNRLANMIVITFLFIYTMGKMSERNSRDMPRHIHSFNQNSKMPIIY